MSISFAAAGSTGGQCGSAGADLVSALTLNYRAEAVGIVRAANEMSMPVVISFLNSASGLAAAAAGFVIGWVARGAETELARLPRSWKRFSKTRPYWARSG